MKRLQDSGASAKQRLLTDEELDRLYRLVEKARRFVLVKVNPPPMPRGGSQLRTMEVNQVTSNSGAQ